jgi:hypothetical protein
MFMHIYYYYKDGFYYVMNDKMVLEKYSVTNNIDLILKQENLIQYFTWELNEECNIFRFKTFEELDYNEKQKIYNTIPAAILLEYCIFKEDTANLVLIQAAILNIINKIYKNRKDTLQAGDIKLENILKNLITYLNSNLKNLKEISHYQKEVVPLSELDENCSKTYIDSCDNLINEYKDYIDIEMDLEFNPKNIFHNALYETYLLMGIDDERELAYQKKIYRIKNKFLENYKKEVELKLDIEKNKVLKDYLFYIANGTITIDMILELINKHINNNFLNNNQKYITLFTIILNITCYIKYHQINKYLEEIPNPILKLEKKDK